MDDCPYGYHYAPAHPPPTWLLGPCDDGLRWLLRALGLEGGDGLVLDGLKGHTCHLQVKGQGAAGREVGQAGLPRSW